MFWIGSTASNHKMLSMRKLYGMKGRSSSLFFTSSPVSVQRKLGKLMAFAILYPVLKLPWYTLGPRMTNWFEFFTSFMIFTVRRVSERISVTKSKFLVARIWLTPPPLSLANSRASSLLPTNVLKLKLDELGTTYKVFCVPSTKWEDRWKLFFFNRKWKTCGGTSNRVHRNVDAGHIVNKSQKRYSIHIVSPNELPQFSPSFKL